MGLYKSWWKVSGFDILKTDHSASLDEIFSLLFSTTIFTLELLLFQFGNFMHLKNLLKMNIAHKAFSAPSANWDCIVVTWAYFHLVFFWLFPYSVNDMLFNPWNAIYVEKWRRKNLQEIAENKHIFWNSLYEMLGDNC